MHVFNHDQDFIDSGVQARLPKRAWTTLSTTGTSSQASSMGYRQLQEAPTVSNCTCLRTYTVIVHA